MHVGGAVDACERDTVRVAQRGELAEEERRELHDVRGKQRHADFVEQRETGGERSDAKEVLRAVFETFVVRAQAMRIALNRCVGDRSSCEPWPAKTRERVVPRDERAEAGRIAEELVERERGEIGGAVAETERVTRRERRGV